MRKSQHRKDIQYLRGIAVLAVVLFHASVRFFPQGFLGVDVFFVISGFVVTPLISRIFTERSKDLSLKSNFVNFYRKRFYRLAPAFIVTLGISSILILLLGPVGDHQRFSLQGVATLLLIGNLGAYKYSEDYFSVNPNPLVHTWSLAVEEQIYLVLPILALLVIANRKKAGVAFILLYVSLTALSLAFFMFPELLQPLYLQFDENYVASSLSFYSTFERAWQFTLGGCAFFLLEKKQFIFNKIINLILISGLFIIIFSPISMSLKNSSTLATFITALIIISKGLEIIPNFLKYILTWLGDRSYSIYLVHMPLMYLAKYSKAFSLGNDDHRIIQSVMAVIFSIFLGAISYSKVEQYYRKNDVKDSRNAIKKTLTLGSLFLMATSLLAVMYLGPNNRYFGLDRNIPVPQYAGYLDAKCERDSETGPPCVYPQENASRKVLLIGDSHAGHISQAVVEVAKNQNWDAIIWTRSSCPVQFSRSDARNDPSDNCLKMNHKMYKWVIRNKPNLIIVSQFIYSDSEHSELRDALKKIKLQTQSVLLVENTPVFPDGKDFMVPRPLLMKPYSPPKSFSYSSMESKDIQASDELAAWARDHAIYTINFQPLFCNNGNCIRFSNKRWLYRDEDHLSVEGANLIKPYIESFFINKDE